MVVTAVEGVGADGGQQLDSTGVLVPNPLLDHSAQHMLDQVLKWTSALAALRAPMQTHRSKAVRVAASA